MELCLLILCPITRPFSAFQKDSLGTATPQERAQPWSLPLVALRSSCLPLLGMSRISKGKWKPACAWGRWLWCTHGHLLCSMILTRLRKPFFKEGRGTESHGYMASDKRMVESCPLIHLPSTPIQNSFPCSIPQRD